VRIRGTPAARGIHGVSAQLSGIAGTMILYVSCRVIETERCTDHFTQGRRAWLAQCSRVSWPRRIGRPASRDDLIPDAPILRWRFEVLKRGGFRVAVSVVVSVVTARLRRGGSDERDDARGVVV
jgi:hypothetical protein